jgi:hypothetical protein
MHDTTGLGFVTVNSSGLALPLAALPDKPKQLPGCRYSKS